MVLALRHKSFLNLCQFRRGVAIIEYQTIVPNESLCYFLLMCLYVKLAKFMSDKKSTHNILEAAGIPTAECISLGHVQVVTEMLYPSLWQQILKLESYHSLSLLNYTSIVVFDNIILLCYCSLTLSLPA